MTIANAPGVWCLFSTGVGTEDLEDIFVSVEAAKTAKPGKWTINEDGLWEVRTTGEPGWYRGRARFVLEPWKVRA